MKKPEKIEKWGKAQSYRAGEIAECADQLAKHDHGYPSRLDTRHIKDGQATKAQSDRCMKRWHDILIKIRDGFRMYEKEGNSWFFEWKDGKVPPVRALIKVEPKKGLPQGGWEMSPTPPGYKLIQNKKKQRQFKEAMRLFVEYFDDLWD